MKKPAEYAPAVTRKELLASMDRKKYKGVHEVSDGYEWISPRGLWALRVPAGLSYTMDHTAARELTKTAGGISVKYDAQIRITGHTGSSWDAKDYCTPLDMMVVPTLGCLDIQGISGDLNQEWTMTAIDAYLNNHDYDPEGGVLKYTSEIAVWYRAGQEKQGNKNYTQLIFCVFCSGTTLVTGGIIVIEAGKLSELNDLIMEMLRSITKVPQISNREEFVPEILPAEFTLRFNSSKDLQIENGVSLPIPDGFKGTLGTSGKIASRKCSIIPEKLEFWNGTGDSSYLPLDISMMQMDMADIPTTPKTVGQIAKQIIQQTARLGVFDLNGALFLARQTAKSSVIYQVMSDYGNMDGFALRVIMAVNSKVSVCTFRLFIHKRIDRSEYNLMLHEAGVMAAVYFQHLNIGGEEELYDNGMAPAKPLSPNDGKEKYTEHLILVGSPYYTTRRSADFRAQPIRGLMKEHGNESGEACALMEIRNDAYDLDRKAVEIAKVFRLNEGLFDPYHDTEAMIRLGIIKEAHSLHALRSLAWTIAVLSENEGRKYDRFGFEELVRIGEEIRRARWLTYAVGGEEERCQGLCGHEDWHVFYVPEQYLSSDCRKREDLRALCGKENRGGNTVSFSVPGLGMNSFSDKKRIDEIIGRNEETLASLEALRTDLEELLPVMENICEGFMNDRDRTRELEGPLADILAAWCALSIAAKEPFYSEEAADTSEANAALDEPLKRPADVLIQQRKNMPDGKTGKAGVKKSAAGQPAAAEAPDRTAAVPKKAAASGAGGKPAAPRKSTANYEVENGRIHVRNKNLTQITIPDGVTVIPESAFCDCGKLTKVFLPESVKCIESKAFQNCEKLSVINFPDGLQTIADSAFSGCKNLKEAVLPQSVREIGNKVFKDCGKLEKLIIQDGITEIPNFFCGNCRSLREVVLPETITSVAEYAFCRCESLRKAVIPDCVIEIGAYAFDGCKELSEISIPKGLKKINAGTFTGCVILTEIIIPESVREIGIAAFSFCQQLKKINIPAKCLNLNDSAFIWCSSLSTITLPEGLRKIPPKAFSNCECLTDVYVPDSVKVIEEEAFKECCALKKIVLPENIKIGKDALPEGTEVVYRSQITPQVKKEKKLPVHESVRPDKSADPVKKSSELKNELKNGRENQYGSAAREADEQKERRRRALSNQILALEKERDRLTGFFAGMKRKWIQKEIDLLKEEIRKL